MEDLFRLYDFLPGIWCEVDVNSRFIYVNRAYAELVGVAPDNKDFLLGKTVADLPCRASESAALFWEEDKRVIYTKSEVQVINLVMLADDQWKIIYLGKKPKCNNDTGEVESILFHITDLTNCPISSSIEQAIFTKIKQEKSKIDSNHLYLNLPLLKYNNFAVREKESEALFFLVRGFSYKQIAQFRGVSPNTVIDQIEKLKLKFNCSSKSELVDKANTLGYGTYFPAHLLTEQASIIIPN